MVRAIERIERELAVLQEAIQAIARELQMAYASYLAALGQALRKQLILASYHLCTQGYPENFLKLSLNQRQQLQQSIRKLGQKAAEILISSLMSQEDEEDEEDEENVEEIVTSLETTEGEIPSELSSSPSESVKHSSPQTYIVETSNPIELAKWQQHLEVQMQQTLRKVSHEANLILQNAGILPQKLPEPVLEAAAAAASEGSAEMMPGPPNILNLVLEIADEQDTEKSGLTQIMTINLRLGEIEFADTTVANHRKQIREILGQLNKLGREYQKKQRERSIAEAEAAWRASWYED
ncbi:hypothetical protein [Nostoc sp. CMAA1605]|uniref:hypothetical protein n=1 Tax=Nostoc sp. CMAA1605 TaxID=2055159 RepID=UPI001F20D6F0|nr:hypothetical protein [Nostoc sp. CMAA1605]MCF4969852.1 hypothetical protein [Nostoc sp. CMAA1605]